MDLGTKEKDLGGPVASPESKEPKINYPSFTIRDDKAREYHDESGCKVGDEHECVVKLRVSGHSDDKFGKSITFDVLSMEPEEDEEGEEGEEGESEDGTMNAEQEEKALGYKRVSAKKESPDISAKSIGEY